jgi:hypothetical protein
MSVTAISQRQTPGGIRWAVKPGAGIVRRADGLVPDVLLSGVRCRVGFPGDVAYRLANRLNIGSQ